MDGRTRIAFSGIAAFAVTATVVATVVTTNVVAVADAPGDAIGAPPVDVKTVATPAATPAPVELPGDPVAEAPAPAPESTADAVPETVPAPAPVEVAPAAPSAPAVSTPVHVAPELDADDLRAALDAGDMEAVYAWAATQGLTREHVDEYLATHRVDDVRSWSKNSDRGADFSHSPDSSGSPTVTTPPQRGDGTKRDRSHGSPDHRD